MPRTKVLIVGAGPTGLVLAIELARRDIPFVLIDRNPQPLPWDRATVVKARSLEIFETLGVAGEFLDRGVIVNAVSLFDRGHEVATIRFADVDSRYAHMLSLPESDTEAILISLLESLGGRVERGEVLTGLKQDEGVVQATIKGPGETVREVEADWLVGTDGLHSAVREAVHDPFEGHDNPMLWAVVDAHINGWRHPGDHIAAQLQKPSANPIPLHDGRWRVYFRPEVRSASELKRVEAGIAEMSPGASFGEHDEPRFFHTHSRVAKHYRVGRVFVAGDAAHACSPIQGHGMNSGIHDSHNLGWKLAAVVRGEASEAILDTYQAERQPIGHKVVDSSDRAEAGFVAQDLEGRERMIAELATPEGNAKAATDESEISHGYLESRAFDYADDDGLAGDRVGFRVGDAAGLATPEGTIRFYELLRDTAPLVVCAAGGACRERLAELRLELEAALGARPVRLVMVTRAPLEPDATHIVDTAGALHQRLARTAPSISVIRPDGYLAARLTVDAAGRIGSVLDHCLFGGLHGG